MTDRSGSKDQTTGKIEAVDAGTFTLCMEQLQEAYVGGIAATAGCLFEPVAKDAYGMDALLVRPGESPEKQETSIYVQLKSTTTVKPDQAKETFSYKLKKRSYFERLAAPRSSPKAILVVMATPQIQASWTRATHDLLELNHCCYWVSLEGQRIAPGIQTPSIHIPIKNIFDANALSRLLDKADRGESLND